MVKKIRICIHARIDEGIRMFILNRSSDSSKPLSSWREVIFFGLSTLPRLHQSVKVVMCFPFLEKSSRSIRPQQSLPLKDRHHWDSR